MTKTNPDSPVKGVHPAADVFPMLDGDELARLAADIKANGLRQPIVLTPDNLVLDGRNRLEACEIAGVPPTFVTYDGDAVAFVLSANIHRRHMTTGQQAMAFALVLKTVGKRRNGRWVRKSVPVNPDIGNKAWANAMADAGTVIDSGEPDMAHRIVNGTAHLSTMAERLRRPRRVVQTVPTPAADPGLSAHVLDAQTVRRAFVVVPDEPRTIVADAGVVTAASQVANQNSNAVPNGHRQLVADQIGREATGRARGLIERLDLELHEIDVPKLTAKAKRQLVEDLARLQVTVDWSITRLGGGVDGEQLVLDEVDGGR